MVTEVKQSTYVAERNILSSLYNASTLVLLLPSNIFMDPLFNFFAKIVFQNHS